MMLRETYSYTKVTRQLYLGSLQENFKCYERVGTYQMATKMQGESVAGNMLLHKKASGYKIR